MIFGFDGLASSAVKIAAGALDDDPFCTSAPERGLAVIVVSSCLAVGLSRIVCMAGFFLNSIVVGFWRAIGLRVVLQLKIIENLL